MTILTLEEARAMLAHIPADLSRDEWARVAMALKAEFADQGFDLFDEFSRRGEKYQAADVRSTWRSVKTGGGVKAGTLVFIAKQHGWRPASRAAVEPPSPDELEARRLRDQDEAARAAERHRACAATAERLWLAATDEGESPYLQRKGLSSPHGARFASGGVLRVPMRDAAGKLWNCQDILPAPMRDKKNGEPTTDKLYAAGRGARKSGLFHLIGASGFAPVQASARETQAAPVKLLAVGEGFATCATVHEATGWPVAVAFDAGNLRHVALSLADSFPDASIVILADNDRDTERRTGKNPGRDSARRAALAVQGVVALPADSDLPEGGSDWNDCAAAHGLDHVRQRLQGMVSAANRKSTASGPGAEDHPRDEGDPFELNDSGVWFHGFDMQGRRRPPMRVCGPLRVSARTRLRNGAGWGYLVEFEDPEGTPKEWVISMAALQGDGVRYREVLADLGLQIEHGPGPREKLARYIQSRRVNEFARLVDRAGWHGKLYCLPGRVFGETEERVLLAPEAIAEHPFRQRGSAPKWRDTIGRVCIGNTRLTFAVSAAFAGPLLRLAGLQSGGLHFVGPSSRGKSTMLLAAASVLGSPEMKRSWRSTDNAVEFLAQLHSDSLLILDELKQCDPKIVGEAVYTLGNGTGRNRAAQRGGLRPTPAWAVLFLSSGELTLEAHMAQARLQPMEGQRVRMPAIPAEPDGTTGTVFERIHEFEGGAELSKYIERQAALQYGHAGLAFIDRVASNFDEMRTRLHEAMAAFRRAHVPDHADGQLGRIADRFALVAAAGELATAFGITGWEESWATAAAVACFNGMVRMRPGGLGSGEEANMLQTVRARLAEHREDWFYDWSRAEEKDNHRPNAPRGVGWRRVILDAAGDASDTEFYCLPDPFRTMLCEGLESDKVLELLNRRGHLITEKGHLTSSVRLPGLGKKRCYRIKSSLLEDFGATDGQATRFD